MPQWPSFLGLPPELRDPATSRAVILPVPYDGTSTWKKGADRGPAAIIEASTAVELYDIETASEPCLQGIATLPTLRCGGLPPEAVAERVEPLVAGILERGQLPVVLGGEHSVTIGAVRAAQRHASDVTVLQIDAHADTRETYEGSDHNHACVMARAREGGPVVQVGIRSLDASERDALDDDRVFWAHEILSARDDTWMDRVVERCTDRVYATIDLDAFDPSVLPATGTPEPGGLSWRHVNELMKRLTAGRTLIGFDVVELLPTPGHHASVFTAAKLVYRVIAMTLAEATERRSDDATKGF